MCGCKTCVPESFKCLNPTTGLASKGTFGLLGGGTASQCGAAWQGGPREAFFTDGDEDVPGSFGKDGVEAGDGGIVLPGGLKSVQQQRKRLSWESSYQLLIEYAEKHGHASPQHSPGVGYWASSMRKQYKEGSLRSDRIAKLQELGFVFDGLQARAMRNSQASALLPCTTHGGLWRLDLKAGSGLATAPQDVNTCRSDSKDRLAVT